MSGNEYIIYYSPDWCGISQTDSSYGEQMLEVYDHAIKKLDAERGDLVFWNNGTWWIGKASNCGEFFKKFSDVLPFAQKTLSCKLINAYLDGFYGTMYGGIHEEVIHIDPKEARISEHRKLYFAWGWPGPDVTCYHLKDYGKTWALTRKELEKGS